MSGPHRLSRHDTLPAVGRDTEAWCGKCGRTLDHVIVAMVGREVVQVRCRTCGGTHRYKHASDVAAGGAARRRTSGDSAARPAAAAKTTAPKSTVEPAELRAARELWRRQMAVRDRATAVRYHTALAPAAGTLLDHAQFGYGLVDTLLDGKARVLFEDGYRILVVGR